MGAKTNDPRGRLILQVCIFPEHMGDTIMKVGIKREKGQTVLLNGDKVGKDWTRRAKLLYVRTFIRPRKRERANAYF